MTADGTAVLAWASFQTLPGPVIVWTNPSMAAGGLDWPYQASSPPAASVPVGGQLMIEVVAGCSSVATVVFAANAVEGSRVLTVTSGGADLRPGLLVTGDVAADASGTIMDVSLPSVTLDSPAPATTSSGTYTASGWVPPGTLALSASPSTVKVSDWNYPMGRTPGDGTAAQNASGQAEGLFIVEFLAAGTYELNADYTPTDANLYAAASTSVPLTVTAS